MSRCTRLALRQYEHDPPESTQTDDAAALTGSHLPESATTVADNVDIPTQVSDDQVDESIPEEFRYNLVFNKKVSELRALFEEQHRQIREEGAEKPKRDVAYQSVICDEQLNQIPLDARSIGLLVQADDQNPAMLSENFEFSLILAMGSSSPGTIDVPFDTSVDTREILYQAESAGFGVNLLPRRTLRLLMPRLRHIVTSFVITVGSRCMARAAISGCRRSMVTWSTCCTQSLATNQRSSPPTR